MSEPMAPALRFDPPLVGPAYRPFTRLITVSFVLGLLSYGLYVLGRRPDVAPAILALLAMAGVVVLISAWYILTGKTTIDREGIHQDWLFTKSYRWHEIARARFIRLPFSGRLLLVTGHGPMRAVHSGNAALDLAFREIAGFYGAPGKSGR